MTEADEDCFLLGAFERESNDRVGRLNIILAWGDGNLNDPISKSSNAPGFRAGALGVGMLKFRVERISNVLSRLSCDCKLIKYPWLNKNVSGDRKLLLKRPVLQKKSIQLKVSWIYFENWCFLKIKFSDRVKPNIASGLRVIQLHDTVFLIYHFTYRSNSMASWNLWHTKARVRMPQDGWFSMDDRLAISRHS